MSDKAKKMAALLRDTAQSASNTVASSVSGPVDLINSGLGKAGISIDSPVMGSKWMESNGLTKEVPMGAPRVIGETLGMIAPSLAASKTARLVK